MNTVLNAENDFEVESKRAIVVHDLEKFANSMLSDLNIERLTNIQYGTKKVCQQSIPWEDNQFWNKLPNPNNYQKQKSTNNFKLAEHLENHCLPLNCKTEKQDNLQIKPIQPNHIQITNNKLTRHFFDKWQSYAKNKKDHKNKLNERIEQKEKLDKFFKMLKQCQHKKQNDCKTSIKLQCKHGNRNNVSDENLGQTEEIQNQIKVAHKTLEGACYQNRFKAQQDIILIQKEKLIKQEKLIHELQFGKLSEEIKQSMEETQKEIRETLSKCSIKVKCQVKPAQIEIAEESLVQFHIKSAKAPKIVQQMEKRALEREHRRQMIWERKRLLDQKKKEAVEREIEKKKVLDEEERKRNLREINERRKKEMEIQMRIQVRKEKFLENCMKADRFYRRKLARLGFKGFLKLIAIKENNVIKSKEFYKMSLKRKGWKGWIEFMAEIDRLKAYEAEQLYNFKLKRKTLRLWIYMYSISIQHLQVAEDLYEFRLQSKMFIHWHRYICIEYVLQSKNLQRAQRHYNRRVLFHCFYQWKTLPAVIQLEKAKEEKKRRWREKVWEILPDYEPAIED